MSRFIVVAKTEADKEAAALAQKVLDSMPDPIMFTPIVDLQRRVEALEHALEVNGIWSGS